MLAENLKALRKAKGLSQPAIIWKHALRNSVTPVVTVLGPIAAGVLISLYG